MNKLISLLTVVVLILPTLMPIAATASHGLATTYRTDPGGISQIMDDNSSGSRQGLERSQPMSIRDLSCLELVPLNAQDPTAISLAENRYLTTQDAPASSSQVSYRTTAGGTLSHPSGGPPAQEPEELPLDPQAMEALRADLLSLADVLNELTVAVQPTAKLNGRHPPPKINKDLVERLSHEELDIMRQAIRDATGGDEAIFKDAIEQLKSLDFTPGKGLVPEKGAPETSPMPPEEKGGSGISPQFFTVIPTPTPTSPGINHRKEQGTVDRDNDALGDLPPPDYATSAGCPTNRYPPPALLALRIVKDVAQAVNIAADFFCETVVSAFLFGSNLDPGCAVKAVSGAIQFAAEKVIDGLEFCDGNVDAAEIEASYENSVRIHLELHDHDTYLQQRADTIDRFLFDFRNLDLATSIEANLASNDAPIASFTLPSSVCIAGVTNSAGVAFKPGCGLLQVVSDTVRTTLDMNIQSKQLTGRARDNAEEKYRLAVGHYNNHNWKEAYGRFREAYKEAVQVETQ